MKGNHKQSKLAIIKAVCVESFPRLKKFWVWRGGGVQVCKYLTVRS